MFLIKINRVIFSIDFGSWPKIHSAWFMCTAVHSIPLCCMCFSIPADEADRPVGCLDSFGRENVPSDPGLCLDQDWKRTTPPQKGTIYIYIWYWVHGWNSALFSAHLQVLHSFFRMGVSEGLGNRKVEVLADTAVTLEQGEDGLVASEVIQKLLSVSAEIQLCMHVCR